MSQPAPLYLSERTLRSCLSDLEIFEVVERTMREMATENVIIGPTKVFTVEIDGVRNRMGSMAGAVVSELAAGLKWFFVPGEERPRDVPHVPATLIVCNAKTGLLEGLLDATLLTCERTAAMGVAVAFACARKPLRNAVVVGAGHIGRAALRYLAATPTIESIVAASRTESSARQAVEQVQTTLARPVKLRATTDLTQAVSEADVVITATSVTADADLVRAAWLRSDAIVCSLGSYREVDLELVSTAWMIVHDVEHVRERRVDLRQGGAGWGRVAGDVASLMFGCLSLPPEGRIYVAVGSIGALDVALGSRALANARRLSLGIPLG